MSLGINCGARTTTCWPNAATFTEVGTTVTVKVMGNTLEHTTVTGRVVVVAVTGDKLRNTLQRKKHIYIYINLLWLLIGIALRVNSQHPWGWYTADIWTSDRHTHLLPDKWMPNWHQHEVLCEPSCNNSWTIIDKTILMTPWHDLRWPAGGGTLVGDPRGH